MQQTRNRVLDRLDALVGEWRMQASIAGQIVASGRTMFDWLESRSFLVQHAEADPLLPGTPAGWIENSPMPVTTMFGLDDTTEQFCMLYADARNVFRIYQMTLDESGWTIWRDAPGFFQRFTATFSADGNTITGGWDGSPDGSTWERDFDQTYTKIG
jgi:hypothetical protein